MTYYKLVSGLKYYDMDEILFIIDSDSECNRHFLLCHFNSYGDVIPTCTVVLLVVINLSDDIVMSYKPPAVEEQKEKMP